MSDAILLLAGNSWCYAPVDGDIGTQSMRAISIGLASSHNGYIKDAFRKESAHIPGAHGLRAALQALGDDEISLIPNEKLCFGNKDGSIAYDGNADICLMECPTQVGIKLQPRVLDDEEIVMTLWPKSQKTVPAKVKLAGKRIWLDFPEEQNKDERCFVFDGGWNGLITASFPVADGRAEVVPYQNIGTWLCSIGSKSASWMSGRFGIEKTGDFFIIEDKKTGKRYGGKFHSTNEEAQDMEKIILSRRLESVGLGALIPVYTLVKA